jgi:DNA-binding transcriptional LysR family regulator
MPLRYGRGMELRHLRYFVGVARELNFTRAALKLRVAQPALSRQIRQLEEELGVKLLERDSRGVQLTEAGRTFFSEACALLKQSEQAIRNAQRGQGTGNVELNLGYVWGLFHSLAPAALAKFRQRHPQTAVHLFDLTATQQAEALVKGELDAGFIGFADEAEAAGLKKRKVGTCTFVAALPHDHRAARKTRVRLESLAEDFFLGISEQTYPGASRQVAEACARAGFRPRILQMVERGYTILSLVAGHCGVALLPESLRALPHTGVVFRPLEDAPVADLWIAWHTGPATKALDGFLSLFEE